MSENNQGNHFYDSDSFISENEDQSSPRKKMSSQPVNRTRREKGTKQIYMGTGKSTKHQARKFPNKQFGAPNYEVSAQRILSARNHKIIDQNNAIHHLTQQIEDLKNENKTLKTQTIRQEKALNKIETKQTDLPRILDQHEAEVVNLKELLRRSKENLSIEAKQRKDSDNEIVKLRDSLSKANQLISDKGLDERNALQLRINDFQERLETKDKYLEASNKHMDNLEKTHKQEIHSLKKQIKKYSTHCHNLEIELEAVKTNLKDKEKLLEIQNIYSQRFKTLTKVSSSCNDRNVGAVYSSEHNNVELLDKLDFSGVSQRREDKEREEAHHDSLIVGGLSPNLLSPERIKQDIRQIIEEEILSGRIRHFEVRPKASGDSVEYVSNKSLEKQSADGRSTVHDSYNTDRAVESEIFDKEPLTQVQAVIEAPPEPEIDHEALERERHQKQLLIQKLSELDVDRSFEDVKDSTELPYSYPRDNGFLANDDTVAEIETIPTSIPAPPSKTYKFSGTIDNLHNGLPSHPNISDSHVRQSKENVKQSRPSLSSATKSTGSQASVSMTQQNNSNLEAAKEDILPPLNSADKKRRENDLLSELFGGDFSAQPVVHGRPYPTGTRKSRSGSLLWENEHVSKTKDPMLTHKDRSMEMTYSEDIEEIVL